MSLTDGDRIALALGSGGARGLAHIGVLRELQQHGVRVEAVAGTSIGAVIGGFFAVGKLDEAEAIYRDMSLNDVIRKFDPVFPSAGLIDGRKMIKIVKDLVGEADVSETDIPFYPVATELDTGRTRVLDHCPLWEAIRASISIPGLFTPFSVDGHWMVDGGLTNPVPVDVLRERHPDVPVLAVNLNLRPHRYDDATDEPDDDDETRFFDRFPKVKTFLENRGVEWFQKNDRPGLFQVINKTLHIVQYEIEWRSLDQNPPEYQLSPQLPDMLFYDFHKAEHAIEEGRRVARDWLNGSRT